MEDPRPSDRFIAQVVAAYAAAEQAMLEQAARILRRAADTVSGRLEALSALRRLVRRTVPQLGAFDQVARAGIILAAREGRQRANGDGGGGGNTPPPPDPPARDDEPFDLSMPHGERAAQAIADDVVSQLEDVRRRITRLPNDIYKLISPQAAMGQVLDNGVRPEEAQAVAWRVFTEHGITGFVDRSGRNWSLSAYVDMSVRTASMRAFNDSHLQTVRALGVRYFTVAPHKNPCPFCFPWVGKVLVETVPERPAMHVDATIEQAVIAGLFHPNAILGDQAVEALGEVQNGVRAWYSGPSVNVTTASGVRLAVSPNHPVLTASGWLPAKFLHEGMQIFRTADRGLNDAASTNEDLDNGVARIKQVLDALAATGGRTTVPAAADDLHGDGRFIQGEIDVVVADRDLVPVVEAHRPHVVGDDVLPGADVQSSLCAGHRAEVLGRLAVERAVAGPLPDFDASSLYATADRRAADAETVGEILAGLPCEVSADQIVGVELDWFEGHAFDLQTSTGAYAASSILVHNCRHVLVPVFPGVTVLPEQTPWTPELQAEYDATQRQRALEREIRKAKQAERDALTPAARAKARKDVRRWQAAIREHVAEHDAARDSRREQVNMRQDRNRPAPEPSTPRRPVPQAPSPTDPRIWEARLSPGVDRRGKIDIPDGLHLEEHELGTAGRLAAVGINVRWNPLVHGDRVKNIDVTIDGEPWEFKSPQGSGKSTIYHQWERARAQGAECLVVDMSRTPLSDEVALAELRRRVAHGGQIRMVLFVAHDGTVTRITRK
ncbi:MAG: hypothetical protein JSS52_11255 [Proteobacteria bacterium]|nr:hypothetical protein [Pseudomonadota bacterium]